MRLRVFSRSQGPNRRRFPRRAAGISVGTALVSVMILGSVTSSAHSDALQTPPPEPEPVSVADIIVAAPQTDLVGFKPPAELPAPAVAPQYRIASDLPTGPLGIPGLVMEAYKLAADRVADEMSACRLPWFLLAGIGRIESNHASNGSVDEFGTTINPIAGPRLDGHLAGNEVITDTDGGAIDGDPNFDRAMGPMQFIPSTWARWGSDANGDGKADPNNVFDATYSASRYLCSGVTDIMAEANQVSAILRYNRSMEYVRNVLGWAGAYATGAMPTNPIPEPRRPETPSTSEESATEDEEARLEDDDAPPSSEPPSSTQEPTPTENCIAPGICLPHIELPPLPGP